MRIELVYFDAGGGHRRALEAVCEVIRRQGRAWQLMPTNLQEVLESLDLFRKLTGVRMQDLYNLMLRKNWTLGAGYLLRLMHGLIRLYHRPMVERLGEHFRRGQPDLVVSLIPHFNRALYEGLRRADAFTPYVTLLTDLADYPPHFWIERQPQYFICGSERAAQQARALGHPPEAIFRVSGMLLDPRFYHPITADRSAERRRLGLDPERPTGLLLFGGHGSRHMVRVLARLDGSALPLQLIVICGHNEKLTRRLTALTTRKPVHVVGFTREISYYMHLADFLIGKPGPGTISEALAMKLPLVLLSNAWTLPHERYNAVWVEQQGLGVAVRRLRRIEDAVAHVLEPENLARYRACAATVRNRAVFEVPAILEQIMSRGGRPAPPRQGEASA